MSKPFIGIVILVLIAGAAGFLILGSDSDADTDSTASTNSSTSSESSSTQPADEADAQDAFTMEEVAQHSTEADCWTYIGYKVYDITSYVPRHPGGDEILLACGADGSSLFSNRTTESGDKVGSGTPHSSSAESQLERLLLGELSQ